MRFIIPVLEFMNEGTTNDTLASVEMASDPSNILRPLQIDRTVCFSFVSPLKRPGFHASYFLSTLTFDIQHSGRPAPISTTAFSHSFFAF